MFMLRYTHMAIPKKTHTTKKNIVKKPAAKKTAAKKGKVFAKARPLTWRFYVVAIGIFAIAVTTMIVIALFTSTIVAKHNNQARLDRINAIYTSLQIPEDYRPTGGEIFGDKRVYEWDQGRTYSSSALYLNGDSVSNTVAELDGKIKAAGFTFIDEPYPGSVSVQYHYKSSKGEYIRLTVSSKQYNDAWQNAIAMGKDTVPQSVYDMDKDAGPSEVTIKVNLDDNNE